MAKANLQQIINEIEGTLSKTIREKYLNKLTHIVPIDSASLKDEFYNEIVLVSPDLLDNPLFTKQVFDNALKILERELRSQLSPYIKGSQIVVEKGSGGYRKISSALTVANTKAIYYIEKTVAAKTNLDPRKLIQFDYSRAVGDVRSAYFLSKIRGGKSFLTEVKENNLISDDNYSILTEIISYYTSGGNKGFQIEVKDVVGTFESGSHNEQRGRTEVQARRYEIVRALKKLLDSKDWINQKGSDSKLENIKKSLINAAVSKGAKGQKQTLDTKSSKVTSKTTIKGNKTTSSSLRSFNTSVKSRKRASYLQEIIKVIPLLNSRLPPAVRANMTGERLHNQTGNFSESVKITGVTQTSQGYPSFNYTYQRSPYDVFDPVLGRSPWNTPGRDPKTLIDKSIRDVAKEMAIGRFYTKRA